MSYERNDSIRGHPLPPPPGAGAHIEAEQVRVESNFRGFSNLQKWKMEDWMKLEVVSLIFRALTLFFSLLTFILVVTVDKFTDWPDLNYLFTMGLIVMVYNAVLTGIKGHEHRTGYDLIPPNIAVWIDFFGDQCLAFMLLSSASCASSMVNRSVKFKNMDYDHRRYIFFDVLEPLKVFDDDVGQAKGAIGMAFAGFCTLQFSALISGYNLTVRLSNS